MAKRGGAGCATSARTGHRVVGALLVRGGAVLLCHRRPDRRWYPACWDLPVEGVQHPPTVTLTVFAVESWAGEPANHAPDEHDAVRWSSVADLATARLADPRLLPFTAGEEDEAGIVFRALFAVRWWIGRRLGWDHADAGPDGRVTTIRDRLPRDLAEGARGPDFATEPSFTAVYQTDREYVAELVDHTVHALMHVGWVLDPATGTHHAVMTSLVRPNGLVGRASMRALRPIRRTLVYPSLVRSIGREWPRYT